MRQDCILGQKWKCINEDGRWRKHKCKFHKEVQVHLAEINKYLTAQQHRRNCACFTPNGVVYTKIKSDRDIMQEKQKRIDSHKNIRSRRNLAVQETFVESMPLEFVNLLKMDKVLNGLELKMFSIDEEETRENMRIKRESDYITQTIDELHSVLLSIESKYPNQTKGPIQCYVESTGKVNCSTIVYKNEGAWKQSRIQTDMLIKVLKDKIDNLKDIRRHLKENRPLNVTFDDYDIYDGFNSSQETLKEFPEYESTSTTLHQGEKSSTEQTTVLGYLTPNTNFAKNPNVIEDLILKSSVESTTPTFEENSYKSNYSSEIFESSTSSTTPGSEFDLLKSQIETSHHENNSTNLNRQMNKTETNKDSTLPAECYCEPQFER